MLDYLNAQNGIPITKARDILTRLPEYLSERNIAVALTRRGKPVLALMPWDLYEVIQETLEVMEDEELMVALRQSLKDVAEGKVTPWEDVKMELGL